MLPEKWRMLFGVQLDKVHSKFLQMNSMLITRTLLYRSSSKKKEKKEKQKKNKRHNIYTATPASTLKDIGINTVVVLHKLT